MPQPESDLQDRVERADTESVGAGLDALDTRCQIGRPSCGGRQADRRPRAAPVIAIALMIGIWQALWAAAIWPEYKLPAPSLVWSNIWGLVTPATSWTCLGLGCTGP